MLRIGQAVDRRTGGRAASGGRVTTEGSVPLSTGGEGSAARQADSARRPASRSHHVATSPGLVDVVEACRWLEGHRVTGSQGGRDDVQASRWIWWTDDVQRWTCSGGRMTGGRRAGSTPKLNREGRSSSRNFIYIPIPPDIKIHC